jgi:protein-export membrane protein SecD
MRNNKGFPVLRAVLAIVMVILMIGCNIAVNYFSGYLDNMYTVYAAEGTDAESLTYEEAIAHGNDVSKRILEEGSVLLKNENNVLPLSANTKKINLFGWRTTNMVFGGAGSGFVDASTAISLQAALEEKNIQVNTDLLKIYTDHSTQGNAEGVGNTSFDLIEPDASVYTDKVLGDAKAFSDTAIITLGSDTGSEYANYLADIISAGKLPFALENVKMESVGASLGERSLSTSLLAGAIGICLVILFMIVFYRVPGVVSSIALLFYSTLFMVVVSVTRLNLSLPGIAGIILTIGMAVDANVIIFERIKEEISNGKTIRAAIDAGYKNAMSAIIDSNVTTIIAAVVLWWLGTGTTVGFAKTLFIGVVLSMIVMLFVSRFMMKALVAMKVTNPALYGAKSSDKEEN